MVSRILLVDDDPAARAVAARALRASHCIDVANEGEEALARIAEIKPDLVITDIVMPRMSGWHLVRHLRASSSTAFIPVILMTALDSTTDRIRGFRIGADDYITKPIDLEELELRVENVLHRSSTTPDPWRGASLSGDLSHFGLSTPLTVLEIERRSGVLTVEQPHNHAELLVRSGRILQATITGTREVAGAEAVYELLMWTTGRFTFAETVIVAFDEIRTSTSSLLLAAAQRMDESIPVEID